jgi:hypothetical protein
MSITEEADLRQDRDAWALGGRPAVGDGKAAVRGSRLAPGYLRQRHVHPSMSGGFGGFVGWGGCGTRTVGTAGRSGRGGRSCFGVWLQGMAAPSCWWRWGIIRSRGRGSLQSVPRSVEPWWTPSTSATSRLASARNPPRRKPCVSPTQGGLRTPDENPLAPSDPLAAGGAQGGQLGGKSVATSRRQNGENEEDEDSDGRHKDLLAL